MAEDWRSRRQLESFHRRAKPHVREVHEHAYSVHFRDQALPVVGQARVARFMTAVGSKVGRVVGEQHLNDAEAAVHLDERNVAHQGIRALERECHRELSLLLRPADVGSRVR